jgi:cyclopropane fatty-acyl-phospholipid synthase-like methyltransferase
MLDTELNTTGSKPERERNILSKFSRTKNRFHQGMIIPPSDLTPCGRLTATPEQFYLSACDEADRLKNEMDLAAESTILDIGCGAGRLPIGLLARQMPFSSYLGVDVDSNRIKWCNKNLKTKDSRLAFQFVNIKNDRYNPAGKDLFDIGISGKKFDLIYLYSVFSHLMQGDVEKYLRIFRASLTDLGHCFVTMFVADNVPACTENPPDFGSLKWQGRLHCVLYNRENWESMVRHAGLEITKITPEVNIDGQTAYYLKRAG